VQWMPGYPTVGNAKLDYLVGRSHGLQVSLVR